MDPIPDLVSHASLCHGTHIDMEGQRGFDQVSKESTSSSDNAGGRKARPFSIDRRTISDAILGLSDGLTVPFALSAGLSSLGTTKIVILGGLAELVAGAISMGLGGFLGARSELYALTLLLHYYYTIPTGSLVMDGVANSLQQRVIQRHLTQYPTSD
jgi:VIT family